MKIKKMLIIILAVLGIMYAEYRFIMVNQIISKVNDHCYTIEIFGQVDEYYID